MQHLHGESSCAQNLRPPQLANLQQARSPIPSDGVVGLRRFDQVQQVAVSRVGGLTQGEALRSWSILATAVSVIGLVEVLAVSSIWPKLPF